MSQKMSRQMKKYPIYSVYVGRLPSNTKKAELRDLFEGCGEIVAVEICQNQNTGQHFGFVRFTNKESALCAVSELNHWVFNGINLIVALENSTAVKIEQEKEGQSVTARDACGPRRYNGSRNQGTSNNTDYIADAMSWARLQESVTAVNLRLCSNGHLSMTNLADDINRVKDSSRTRLWGSVDDATTTFSQISSKIMQRCQAKGEEEKGKQNCAQFMSALRTIMKEIEAVLGKQEDCQSEEIQDKTTGVNQLALEENLVREVNEELNKDTGVMNGAIDDEGRHINDKESQMPRKRLSDASVQTANCAEDNDTKVPDCFSDRELTQSHFILQPPVDRLFDCNHELIDPAIIDFHLSQVKENKEMRREIDKSKSPQQAGIVQEMFSNMTLEDNFNVRANIERSDSRDSSLSDEGIIDDSGVESDCFGGVKGRRSLDSKLGVNVSYRDMDVRNRRTLHGSAPSLKQFDLDQYVRKNVGRGSASHHLPSLTPALGRGILTNFKSLQHPVGRGQQS